MTAFVSLFRAVNVGGRQVKMDALKALHESLGCQAIGVYEKVGFKHGGWRDVGWWCKKLQPLVDKPPPPRRPRPR